MQEKQTVSSNTVSTTDPEEPFGLFFGASSYHSSCMYPSIDGTLKYLSEWEFQSALVIDVGACHGD